MFSNSTTIRVRYSETDRMQYAYYGNYASWFEVARVEALRSLGISYKELEDSGILLPVSDFTVKYLRPAYYDDALTVKTTIPEMPGVRIKFDYEVYKNETLLTTASTTLVFIDAATGRPTRPPKAFIEKISTYF